MSDTTYNPDCPSSPGETLAELLRDRGLSIDEAAEAADLRTMILDAIVQGYYSISPAIANALEHALGTPAQFWITRQHQYDIWKQEAKIAD